MNTRLQLLEELLAIRRPVQHIATELSKYAWDSVSLIELTPEHVIQALQRYLKDDLRAEDIEIWANAIEGRDDIRFQTSSAESLRSAIHVLANPVITQRLDSALATKLCFQLRGLQVQK